MTKKLLLILFIFFVHILFSQNKYSKRITITNFTQQQADQLTQLGIDLHCGAYFKGNDVQLELNQHELDLLDKNNINYHVDINNLTKYYAERNKIELPLAKAALKKLQSKKKTAAKTAELSNTTIDNYLQYDGKDEINWTVPSNLSYGSMGGALTVDDVYAQLDLMRSLYPNLITARADASPSNQKTWGNTLGSASNQWPGQTIYFVKISDNPDGADDNTEPDILYTSNIHAREAGAVFNQIFYMWYLLENYSTNSAVKNLVDNNELFFVPVANPDGLKWDEKIAPSGGGMQRKNLRPNAGDSGTVSSSNNVRGVDLNRNFDYFWGSAGTGSSGTPSNDTYRGPSAFSEPETQILRDFILAHDFKIAEWHHTYSNAIPHPYGGNPTFVSGREDEMAKWHEAMTKYNRYISGATIFSAANGIADDWMVGGATDSNGSVGSGRNILATTPENGHSTEGGFWPSASNLLKIAKRAMRINLMNVYFGGAYAKFYDLTQSDINSLSSNLTFGIERLGQTAADFTLTVTPVSANIQSIVSPATQTGMAKLEQRNVTASLTLDPSIQPNDKIEFKIALSNGSNTFYETNIIKYYQPTVLFADNPDTDNLTNWTNSGFSINSTDSFTGSKSIQSNSSKPYANNLTRTITTANSYNLSSASKVLVQFYTKWDLERNFDFVELLGSTDGSTWQALTGKYTKPAATSQTNDSHRAKSSTSYSFESSNSAGYVYDADELNHWKMEEIVIDAANNNFLNNATTAYFRFNFRTDANNKPENYSTTYDGFYFDDFKVISVQIPCAVSVPTGLTASSITASSANISWDNIPSATYDLRYRVVGNSTWTNVMDLTVNSTVLNSLTASTNYEVQVRSKCSSSNTSAYTASTTFSTPAVSYCASSGNATASDEYIGRVQLGTIDNSSANEKYGDFTAMSTNLVKGSNASITITPTWTGATYNEGYSVWIDYNKNGSFNDAGEQVFIKSASKTTPVNGSFTIPVGATLGTTRMRVSMKYNGIPTSCETITYGEVEDYTVNIESALGIEDEILDQFSIYPNPTKNKEITINVPSKITSYKISITNLLGQELYYEKRDNTTNYNLKLKGYKPGIYFITVATDKGKSTKKLIIQ